MELQIAPWVMTLIEYLWKSKESILEDGYNLDDILFIDRLSEENYLMLRRKLFDAYKYCKTKRKFFKRMINIISHGILSIK